MRAERKSLLSSLGAAVSLTAAAGLALFLVAAIVAFHGPARVASSGLPGDLVVSSDPARAEALFVGGASAPARRSTRGSPRSPVSRRPSLAAPGSADPAVRLPSVDAPARPLPQALGAREASPPAPAPAQAQAPGPGAGGPLAPEVPRNLASAVDPVRPPAGKLVGAVADSALARLGL
ncbi:MAG: hypothetical protein NVSMB51_19640 [Solirubrobacteraceae bacterium]